MNRPRPAARDRVNPPRWMRLVVAAALACLYVASMAAPWWIHTTQEEGGPLERRAVHGTDEEGLAAIYDGDGRPASTIGQILWTGVGGALLLVALEFGPLGAWRFWGLARWLLLLLLTLSTALAIPLGMQVTDRLHSECFGKCLVGTEATTGIVYAIAATVLLLANVVGSLPTTFSSMRRVPEESRPSAPTFGAAATGPPPGPTAVQPLVRRRRRRDLPPRGARRTLAGAALLISLWACFLPWWQEEAIYLDARHETREVGPFDPDAVEAIEGGRGLWATLVAGLLSAEVGLLSLVVLMESDRFWDRARRLRVQWPSVVTATFVSVVAFYTAAAMSRTSQVDCNGACTRSFDVHWGWLVHLVGAAGLVAYFLWGLAGQLLSAFGPARIEPPPAPTYVNPPAARNRR